VVRTPCQDNKAVLVKFENDLFITAWHPVKINNKWIFPFDAGQLVEK